MGLKQTITHEAVTGFKFGKPIRGLPKFYAHVYYVDGLLIDTGHIKVGDAVRSTLQDWNVQQMYLTHHHEDHTGNIEALQQQFTCPVYASALCSTMMKQPPRISFAQKLTWGDRPAYLDIIPKEGTIETDRFQFQIIPIPGHAPDMVALYEPNQKWLFSADLYINSFIGYFLREESIVDQIDSIQRILELDFGPLFCGHNPQLTGGREKLAKKLTYLTDFYTRISEWAAAGHSEKQIFKKMELKEFRSIKFLSGGDLSKMNMVRSAVRDYRQQTQAV